MYHREPQNDYKKLILASIRKFNKNVYEHEGTEEECIDFATGLFPNSFPCLDGISCGKFIHWARDGENGALKFILQYVNNLDDPATYDKEYEEAKDERRKTREKAADEAYMVERRKSREAMQDSEARQGREGQSAPASLEKPKRSSKNSA